MPRLETIICDCGCGVIKQETNRWWMVRQYDADGPTWAVGEWNDKFVKSAGTKFAAGESCAHRMLSQFMAEVTGTTPDPQRESTLELKPPLTREGKASDEE